MTLLADKTLEAIKEVDGSLVNNLLTTELLNLNKKVIVLDDDPTGVQTVHGISVYTDWTKESIEQGFNEENSMFFILTNSRGLTAAETTAVHKEVARNIAEVSQKLDRDFIIISRSDSTLRGHYPLETKVLKDTVEANHTYKYDGEILFPFFKEGGRLTINNVHYVQYGSELIPAGETEFAKDRTFGYTNSHLGAYIEEKTAGEYTADNTTYISLEDLRNLEIDKISEQLVNVNDFNKVVVNAVDYVDVKIFTIALIRAMNQGKHFIFRSAAALTKVIGGVSDKGLLTREELVKEETETGGIIVVGSHVQKTTEQLNELMKLNTIEFVQFDCHLVLNPELFDAEVERVISKCNSLISEGKTVAAYTRRERLDLGENMKEEELMLSVKISDAVTSIVERLQVRPKFIVAKGGITSSDVGTKGLRVKKAIVSGQIKPGIPVWSTGEESKFPGMSYVIFPGNVGTKDTLREAVELLIGQ